MDATKVYDAVIVGGGFAGLSAAMWLGRYRRLVLVVSSGRSRNASSHVVHGYPGYDGADPRELLEQIKAETLAYGVEMAEARVDSIRSESNSFEVTTSVGSVQARRILIATGISDVTPSISNFADFDGVSAWHCPACDGHEYSDKKIVVVGWGAHICGYIEELLTYTSDITLLTDGHSLDDDARRDLAKLNITVVDTEIERLIGTDGELSSVQFENGETVKAEGLFYSIKQVPRMELLEGLGCEIKDDAVTIDRQQKTSVTGVYAAGDIAPLEELVVVACAMGVVAASNMHKSLKSYVSE